jgi:NADH-quinone oxidoreductase E subunit
MSDEHRLRDPVRQAEVITELDTAQQRYGYLSQEALTEVSQRLGVSLKDVYTTASFYTGYHMEPTGRYVIQVCEGLTCHLVGGAERLVDHLSKDLGIQPGGTTPDGKFTLEVVPCLAACDLAPAMRINDELYERLTLDQVDAIIDMLAGG